MSSAKPPTAQNQPAYSSRLRAKPPASRPNYAEIDDSDLDSSTLALASQPSARPSRGGGPVVDPYSTVDTHTDSPASGGGKQNGTRSTDELTPPPPKRRRRSPSPASDHGSSSSEVSELGSDVDMSDPEAAGLLLLHQDPAQKENEKAAPTGRPSRAAAALAGPEGNGNDSSTPESTTLRRRRRKNVANATALTAHTDASQQWLTSRIAGRHSVESSPATEMTPRPRTVHYFEQSEAKLDAQGRLISDDGTSFERNDFVYLICEPPGEPYYIGRIMEFLHQVPDSTLSTSTNPTSLLYPVKSVRVNWVYRPRDVQRSPTDSRIVYATMHSDICPLSSLRGRCHVVHRDNIDDMDEFRKIEDAFWFNQAFDRFIHRMYDVVPTRKVINVPARVKRALDAHWKYIVVESGKVKELTSDAKTCKRCSLYCATNDSVDCAVCDMSYHMNCVRPPLLKKPSRGFAWACAPCNRAQERKIERAAAGTIEEEEEELVEEGEQAAPPGETTSDQEVNEDDDAKMTGDDANDESAVLPLAEAEVAQADMWQMRYLGMHCRLEDVLQYDDRAIYPRASSRLGPRHQATVSEWFGRPVQFVKPAEVKRKSGRSASSRKDAKAAAAAAAAEEANRPGWIQTEPPGYVHRGEDTSPPSSGWTAKLQFAMPTFGEHSERGLDDNQVDVVDEHGNAKGQTSADGPNQHEALIDDYMTRARTLAKTMDIADYSVDYLDRALNLLFVNNFDGETALKQLKKTDKVKHLRDPFEILTDAEKKKFKEGVNLYGSELRNVRMYTGIQNHGDVVRYYYIWKKTPEGREVCGGYGNHKSSHKKKELDPVLILADELADEQDDSAFDSEKAVERRKRFQCKFCGGRRSRLWRRAPIGPTGTETGRTSNALRGIGGALIALCHRCAHLWRRYAIRWEDGEEIGKRVAQGGGRAWRRRIDEELLAEWRRAREGVQQEDYDITADPHPRKRAKKEVKTTYKVDVPKVKNEDKTDHSDDVGQTSSVPEPRRRSVQPAYETSPDLASPIPEPPRFKMLTCAVCNCEEGEDKFPRLVCTVCRLHVHASCYGVTNPPSSSSWMCDMCTNDKVGKESTSYSYECVLCPVTETEQDVIEPSSNRQADRDAAAKFAEDYRLQQRQYGRPVLPREPLKRTGGNSWVHVKCAVWMPEVRFSSAKALEQAEGIPLIPTSRFTAMCSICGQKHKGACVECAVCSDNMHIGCAVKAGYHLGFHVQPTKSGRRDSASVLTLGNNKKSNIETGLVTPVIICLEHDLSTTKYRGLHTIHELPSSLRRGFEKDLTALQLYVRTYKQADISLTGTTRKANTLDECRKINGPTKVLNVEVGDGLAPRLGDDSLKLEGRQCRNCRSRTSFVWFPINNEGKDKESKPLEYLCVRCKHNEGKLAQVRNESGSAASTLALLNQHSKPSTLASVVNGVCDASRVMNRLGGHIRSRAVSPAPLPIQPPPVAAAPIVAENSPPAPPATSVAAIPPRTPQHANVPIQQTSSVPAPGSRHGSAQVTPTGVPGPAAAPTFTSLYPHPTWPHRPGQPATPPVHIPSREWHQRTPNGVGVGPANGPVSATPPHLLPPNGNSPAHGLGINEPRSVPSYHHDRAYHPLPPPQTHSTPPQNSPSQPPSQVSMRMPSQPRQMPHHSIGTPPNGHAPLVSRSRPNGRQLSQSPLPSANSGGSYMSMSSAGPSGSPNGSMDVGHTPARTVLPLPQIPSSARGIQLPPIGQHSFGPPLSLLSPQAGAPSIDGLVPQSIGHGHRYSHRDDVNRSPHIEMNGAQLSHPGMGVRPSGPTSPDRRTNMAAPRHAESGGPPARSEGNGASTNASLRNLLS